MFVLDASTLILLAKVELLDPFGAAIGSEVAIPEEVERGCCRVKRTLDALMIQKAVDESRIKVMAFRNKRLLSKLAVDFGLGKGEAEAVTLALQERAQLLGIDDQNGINACKLLGIRFTTAVGILVRSCEKGLLSRGDALGKLTALEKHGRYKSSSVEDARLRLEARE